MSASAGAAGSFTLSPANLIENSPFVVTFTFQAPADCGRVGSHAPTINIDVAGYIDAYLDCGATKEQVQTVSYPVQISGVPAGFYYVGAWLGGTFGVLVASGDLWINPSVAPLAGLWWNPTESGSGYVIDVKHGVLVMTVFSYAASGAPQWYLLSGPLVNNAVTGKLFKFAGGQCIGCAYQLPVASGDDGVATVTFTSPIAATLQLPGGRTIPIVPQEF